MFSSRKGSAVGIIIALIVGLVSGYAIRLEVDTTELGQQVSDLEGQVTNLQNDVLNKSTQISNLQSQITDLEQQVEAKNNQILTLQSEISNLEQQLELEILGIFFSPNGSCEDKILYWISRANVSIHILIYSFTLDSVGDALVEAHNRGVEVRVVFEKGQISQYSEYQRLKSAGIEVRNDTNSKYMHNKIMIVDSVVVLTGSFNWSNNAENYNNENLIIVSSTYIAAIYEEEFNEIWNESI